MFDLHIVCCSSYWKVINMNSIIIKGVVFLTLNNACHHFVCSLCRCVDFTCLWSRWARSTSITLYIYIDKYNYITRGAALLLNARLDHLRNLFFVFLLNFLWRAAITRVRALNTHASIPINRNYANAAACNRELLLYVNFISNVHDNTLRGPTVCVCVCACVWFHWCQFIKEVDTPC